jgi:hypothetical protein
MVFAAPSALSVLPNLSMLYMYDNGPNGQTYYVLFMRWIGLGMLLPPRLNIKCWREANWLKNKLISLS